jgi:hypothetical protein
MAAKFQALIEAGPTCEKYDNKAKLFLAMTFCYACDPNQPATFSPPLNGAFFNASKTAKICRTVTDGMAPRLFSDCGLLLPDDRERSCSPNSAVVPEIVWADCESGEYVCQDKDQNWFCSGDPCTPENTPAGFANEPCDTEARTCDGALKFLNDNRAAKPPYFESYVIEIVDEARCMAQHDNATRCQCMRSPLRSNGAQNEGAHRHLRLLLLLLVVGRIII